MPTKDGSQSWFEKYKSVFLSITLGSAAIGIIWNMPAVVYSQIFEERVQCTIREETAPIERTLDYLIACWQSNMNPEDIARADSIYSQNKRWKELRKR